MIKLSDVIAIGNLTINVIRLVVDTYRKLDNKKDRSKPDN